MVETGRAKSGYGTWLSPYSPERMASSLRLQDVQFSGRALVWMENRSDRGALCVQEDPLQAPRDLTPEHSVRARLGYGGGDFGTGDDAVFYVAERRIWRKGLEPGPARPVTPQEGESASPVVSPDGRCIAYVHEADGAACVAVVDAQGRKLPRRLAQGRDFYMQPAWHPDGRRLAFVGWDHPNMPWMGTFLEIVDVSREADGLPLASACDVVAGGAKESIFQPIFSSDGSRLAFASDRSGWWNVELLDLVSGERRTLVSEPAEHAVAAWRQGMRTLAFSADGRRLYYLRNAGGEMRLCVAQAATGESRQVKGELAAYRELLQLSVDPTEVEGDRIALLASGPHIPPQVLDVRVDPRSPDRATVRVVRRSGAEDIPALALSAPQAMDWMAEGGDAVHGIYYPPASETAFCNGAPPLIVRVHGGPTGQNRLGYDAQAQFFATRGYAFLDVNHRGSYGYGRSYRQALEGKWGILDLEDVTSGARHLATQGLADAGRMVVMGASAGGFTVLRALTAQPGVFRAGISLFGVSNLFTLAAQTHKFESRYLDSMVGPLPEAAERYRSRSPIFSVDAIRDPIALYQGDVDPVVPKAQAEAVAASLVRRSVPHVFELYEGEGHGWRKSETIAAFYRSVDRFLLQYVVYA